MNSVSTGHSSVDKHIEMGIGFGGGLLLSIPLTNIITFVPEVNFLYRTLMEMNDSDEDCDRYSCYEEKIEYSVSEFALSFPLMFQFAPIAGTPIYFAGGVQIDIPFSSKEKMKWSYTYDGDTESNSESEKMDNRAKLDFGIALGSGFRISSTLGIDAKVVIGMSSLSTDKDNDIDLTQYGIGVSVFF